MWGPAGMGLRREIQVTALSVEPPIPRYLRNPDSGYRPSHSSGTGLAGTEDFSRSAWRVWALWVLWFPSTGSGQALRGSDGLRGGSRRTGVEEGVSEEE